MIKFSQVTFSYKNSKRSILNELNVEFPAGGVVGLIGRNGVGKTTLFDLICKNLSPLKGEVEIPNKKILLLGQNMSFPYRMTVAEAVQFTFLLNGLDLEKSMDKLFEIFGAKGKIRWENIKDQQMGYLSNGETKWLCVVVSLSLDRDIYLLDEPTDGVDPEYRYEIWNIIHRAASQKDKLFIVSSHLLNEMQSYIKDLYFLKNGKIEYYNSIQDFCDHYGGRHGDEAFVRAHT